MPWYIFRPCLSSGTCSASSGFAPQTALLGCFCASGSCGRALRRVKVKAVSVKQRPVGKSSVFLVHCACPYATTLLPLPLSSVLLLSVQCPCCSCEIHVFVPLQLLATLSNTPGSVFFCLYYTAVVITVRKMWCSFHLYN